jgi:hypothetical protein
MTVSMNDFFQQKVRVINPFIAAPAGSGTVTDPAAVGSANQASADGCCGHAGRRLASWVTYTKDPT